MTYNECEKCFNYFICDELGDLKEDKQCKIGINPPATTKRPKFPKVSRGNYDCNKCCSKCMDKHTHLCKKSCFYSDLKCCNCKYKD